MPYHPNFLLYVGAPGNGVQAMVQYGQNISRVFQGAYDIVSWDRRGIGLFTLYASSDFLTITPHVSFSPSPGAVTCFDSQAEEEAFFQNTIFQSINQTIAGRFDQQDLNDLFSRTEESSRLLLEFGERCQHGPAGKYLQFLGTSSTIRDLVSLGDCIVGEDKPIDYWGFSYGTVIGMNFLNSESRIEYSCNPFLTICSQCFLR